jgi:predicted secreted Zn-dependent protease
MTRFRHVLGLSLAALLGTSLLALGRLQSHQDADQVAEHGSSAAAFGGLALAALDGERAAPSLLRGVVPELRPQLALGEGLQTSIDVQFYDVAGASSEALRTQLRELGPRDASGRWAAATRWNVSWSFPYLQSEVGCVAGPVNVYLALSFTYPRWATPGQGSPDLAARWQRYLDAVIQHENGHRDIALEGAEALRQALTSLPPTPTCEQFGQSVQATANNFMTHSNERQVQYDQLTSHGASQGAVLH